MEFRRAQASDAERVRQLIRQAYARWVPVLGREPVPMQVDYHRAVRDHEIDLFYADGDLAALIEFIPYPDHLFIENIAVAPKRQGQGLGRYLLSYAEQKARAANLARLCLLTAQAFEANVRLYRSAGFQIDRTEPFMGGTTVHMSKPIALS